MQLLIFFTDVHDVIYSMYSAILMLIIWLFVIIVLKSGNQIAKILLLHLYVAPCNQKNKNEPITIQ